MSAVTILPEDVATKSEAERIELANKIGHFLSINHSNDDHITAEHIANILVRDTAIAVRKTLAAQVQKCRFLSPEIALEIVNDIDEVSEPFILHSDYLESDNLEEIARECDETAREHIARRAGLPEPVSFVISEVGKETAVANLMQNLTAEVSDRVCKNVTERFADNESVLNLMAERDDLPVAAISDLIAVFSDQFAENLLKKYGLSREQVAYVAGETRIKATQDALEDMSEKTLIKHYAGLHKNKLLNDGLLIQLLTAEKMKQFCVASSIRADVDVELVKRIILEGTLQNVTRLFEKMKIGKGMMRIFLDAYHEAKQGNMNI